MMDQDDILDQLRAFYHVYPSLAATVKRMDDDIRSLQYQLVRLRAEDKIRDDYFVQYKMKIQKIEQFLIEHGLIKLMAGSSRGRAD